MLNLDKVRMILNIIFMVGALSTIIIYFTVENPMVMFIVCCFTIFVKFIEYALRFTQNSLNKNKRRNDDD
ncbi:hypothetical protein [uncultured Bacteroides sp.]|uniref:hypothetical protein n=1 Tax=uncultured Bacteroides sp. TaxID=162156 RepID=UPI002AAAEDFE|nr:hypothetical protein [uncultured Bacteroides sp.]